MLVVGDAVSVAPEIGRERVDFVIGVWIVLKARRSGGARTEDNCTGFHKVTQLVQNFRGHLLRGRENQHTVGHAAVEMNSIGVGSGVMKEDVGVDVVVIVARGWSGLEAGTPERHRRWRALG